VRSRWILGLGLVQILTISIVAHAEGGASSDRLNSRQHEIEDIKHELHALEHRIDQLESENAQLKQANERLTSDSRKFEESANQQIETIKTQASAPLTPANFADAFERYLGRYRFTLVGGAAGSFIYDRQSGINTFALDMEPILLWQLSDRMLLETTIEANLPAGSSAEFQLPVATLQVLLHKYLTLVMGIYDQPFGDWFEDQSPFWVNRFVTSPLPYGVNTLIPPTDVGVQLRGAAQWGKLGQTVDYTLMMANGPGFSDSSCSDNVAPSPHPSCPPERSALVGDTLTSPNNIRLNTHSAAFGARIRVYPLPVDSNLGRLELGASTYNGKWLNGLWYKAWGVDFNYFRKSLQARGEWIQTYRQMGGTTGADNRQGWYVQVGYFLNGLHLPSLPPELNADIGKFEPLVRYSGINQRAVVQSEIITTPGIGFTGSPAVFAPHAREVALGLDYWFTPSMAWQNEFDFEIPRQGGFYSDTGDPIHATANDRAFVSQFAIGF
jgi:hypothetical protein